MDTENTSMLLNALPPCDAFRFYFGCLNVFAVFVILSFLFGCLLKSYRYLTCSWFVLNALGLNQISLVWLSCSVFQAGL